MKAQAPMVAMTAEWTARALKRSADHATMIVTTSKTHVSACFSHVGNSYRQQHMVVQSSVALRGSHILARP